MTRLLILLSVLSLASCAMIESDAGKAHYSYKVTTPDGTVHEIDLQNAKDIGLVSATVKYGEVEVELIEEGVNASSAMGIMAEQNASMMKAVLDRLPLVQ